MISIEDQGLIFQKDLACEFPVIHECPLEMWKVKVGSAKHSDPINVQTERTRKNQRLHQNLKLEPSNGRMNPEMDVNGCYWNGCKLAQKWMSESRCLPMLFLLPGKESISPHHFLPLETTGGRSGTSSSSLCGLYSPVAVPSEAGICTTFKHLALSGTVF